MMYDVSDTIVAVSSPSGGVRSIVRITGPQTGAACERFFAPGAGHEIHNPPSAIRNRTLLPGSVRINESLAVDALLYRFVAPHSYTGEDLAEIHLHASPVVVEALVQGLLAAGLRAAGPGEFTARAYLNGKLDLAQAEAVNEVISSSNCLQLAAAEKLLSGRLTQTADEIPQVFSAEQAGCSAAEVQRFELFTGMLPGFLEDGIHIAPGQSRLPGQRIEIAIGALPDAEGHVNVQPFYITPPF